MPPISACAFCISLGAILYVLAGYPLLLAFIAKRRVKPVHKDNQIRSVSIVIAVRNGETFITAKLRSILALNYPRESMQIIVVSDGSTDGTDDLVAAFLPVGIEFFRIESSGKATAINKGVSFATGEILVLTDVRQTLHPDSLRNLVGCFGDDTVGAVSGELFIRPGVKTEESDTRLYWRYEVFIRKQMSRIDSTFGTSGPFYALRRSLAVPIPPDTLLDDVYLPLAAFFRGYRIVLDETAKAYDYPTNLNSEFKRKIRTQAGLYQILHQYPQLLSPNNRMRFHFLSAKFGRLTIPFFLIIMAVSTFYLPEPLKQLALVAQTLFYSVAILDVWIPNGFPAKRYTSPVRSFVVLITAALFACKIMFTPPRKLWKETKVRFTLP